jgi:hypothetical protein
VDDERPDADLLPGAELDDGGEAPAAEEAPRAPRSHDRDLAAQAAKRGEVEMVVVDVGDEHRIEPREPLEHERLRAS